MEKVLQVKDLKISFRTNNGSVKAVREVNFDLFKGETLGIVGESGSGKSVTARAMLGILAGNKIIEGGELLYEGQDLLRLSESDFYNIRGTKISMIFQDPLSSLNPIMRIGKQITEAMILKSKTSRKVGKHNLAVYNKAIKANLDKLAVEQSTEFNDIIKTYHGVMVNSIRLENEYDHAFDTLERTRKLLQELLEIVKTQGTTRENITSKLSEYFEKITRCNNPYIITKTNEIFILNQEIKAIVKSSGKDVITLKARLNEVITKILEKVDVIYKQATPDFLKISISEKMGTENTDFNTLSIKYNNYLKEAIKASREKSVVGKKLVIGFLNANKVSLTTSMTKGQARSLVRSLRKLLKQSADLLSPGQDKYFTLLASQLGVRFNEYYALRQSELKSSKKSPASENVFNDSLDSFEKIKEFYNKVIESLTENITKEYNVDEVVEKLNENYKENILDFVDYIGYFEAKQNALDLMREVGIKDPEKRFRQYPFQFSGGMRQRIVIAIAISFNPDILICDEPTTALDVTIQAQILELINKIKSEHNLSVIFITHDLGVIANMADRIGVMYAGKIVEFGKTEEVFYDPKHPYTWALLSSIPDLDTKEKLESIPGTPPNMIHPPKGDAFAVRNKYAMQIDFEQQPPMFKVTDTHYAATWLLHPNAPKVEKPKIVTERIERVTKQLGVNTNGD